MSHNKKTNNDYLANLSQGYYFFVILLILAWLFLSQLTFYSIQENQSITTVKTLDSLFHALTGPSNIQTLSAFVTDLELNGTIQCPVVLEKNDDKVHLILDLSYRGGCIKNPWILNGDRLTMITKSSNGDQFEIHLSTVNSVGFLAGLWGVRLFGLLVILGLSYIRNVKAAQEQKIGNAKLAAAKAIEDLTNQVSHDIRSPLAALNLVVSSLTDVPEDKRILIRSSVSRITDIANQLLLTNNKKVLNQAEPFSEDSKTVELLPAVTELLVSEKRIQFRELSNIHIESELENAYGAFTRINSIEFKRVLSNLINNAVEALQKTGGCVRIRMSKRDNSNVISIQDNGKGIPKEILHKIGKKGLSLGKDNLTSGFGLGLYHAIKTIESFGGTISFRSDLSVGTEIIITLPSCSTPTWFIPELAFQSNQLVVALDDDQSVLDVWKQRFGCSNVNLFTFTSASEFSDWVSKNKDKILETCFLVDYEMIGQKSTGLDLIETLGLRTAVLVTSRYEELEIRQRCEAMGIKQLPKGMAPFVPLKFLSMMEIEKPFSKYGKGPMATPTRNSLTPSNEADGRGSYDLCVLDDDREIINRPKTTREATTLVENKIRYDLCLLDDDRPLVQSAWAMEATRKGHNIKMFSTPEEFQSAAYSIDRETPIFIDVSLGNGVSGVDFAEEVHKMGFLDINLATGYPADSIKAPSYVSRIIGKDYPEDI